MAAIERRVCVETAIGSTRAFDETSIQRPSTSFFIKRRPLFTTTIVSWRLKSCAAALTIVFTNARRPSRHATRRHPPPPTTTSACALAASLSPVPFDLSQKKRRSTITIKLLLVVVVCIRQGHDDCRHRREDKLPLVDDDRCCKSCSELTTTSNTNFVITKMRLLVAVSL